MCEARNGHVSGNLRYVAAVLLGLFCSVAHAQSNDVAVLVGGVFSPDTNPAAGVGTCPVTFPSCGATIQSKAAVAYEGVLAHRLLNFHLASVHLELPVLGTPTRPLQQGTFRQDFSTVFVTPGVRLRVSLPLISPFVSVGGGFAHFSASSVPQSAGKSNTTSAFQVGGGFDVGTPVPLLGLRGEVREFYTGTPGFSIASPNRNSLFVGGGIVLKF
jgi:hypothetical protein